jgi:hypothetical protein
VELPSARASDAARSRPAGVIDPAASQLMDSLRGWSALVVASAHASQVFLLPKFGLYGLPHPFSSWLAC